MTTIKIKGFDPNRLEELAKEQTEIYNEATSTLPNYIPAKVEDTINRFKRKQFDQSRMFYAYDKDRMIAYSGLSGRDKERNSRNVGYPWLTKGTDPSVKDLLYDAMEKKCRDEGTKLLRRGGSPEYPEQLEFFKSKGFEVKIEYLVHEKVLTKNEYELPEGYIFREMKREDLLTLEEVSRKDPLMKSPFIATDYEQYMDSTDYDPENVIVVEKEGTVVGFYGIYVPPDPKMNRAYFGGAAVHGDHQVIEPYLIKEMENRALTKGKEKLDVTFFPDSPRLAPYREQGYKQYSHSFQLEKEL